MKKNILALTVMASASLGASFSSFADEDSKKNRVERGRYVVATAGCNDCHTMGYAQTGGKSPESDWLMGNSVGFSGPWGTTYPKNLRLLMQDLTEKQWLELASKEMRPPMPWFILRDMTKDDLRAIYAFVRNLGPAGAPAPNYVPPGQPVATPYIEFMPKNLPQTAMR